MNKTTILIQHLLAILFKCMTYISPEVMLNWYALFVTSWNVCIYVHVLHFDS